MRFLQTSALRLNLLANVKSNHFKFPAFEEWRLVAPKGLLVMEVFAQYKYLNPGKCHGWPFAINKQYNLTTAYNNGYYTFSQVQV